MQTTGLKRSEVNADLLGAENAYGSRNTQKSGVSYLDRALKVANDLNVSFIREAQLEVSLRREGKSPRAARRTHLAISAIQYR